MIYHCLACQSTTGTPLANGNEEWHWKPLGRRRAGPFCSRDCADAWMLWPEDDQLRSIFGDVDRARAALQCIDDGGFVQDTPGKGDVLWRLDFGTIKHRNTQQNDRAGLPGATCPHPTEKSLPGLEHPDCCLGCTFVDSMGWREVVAR